MFDGTLYLEFRRHTEEKSSALNDRPILNMANFVPIMQ
jgi:hypothetical protein